MTPASALSESALALCFLCILLVPFAGAGLALITPGWAARAAPAHSMLASLCVMAVAAIVYFVCGFAWEGFAGRPAHSILVAGKLELDRGRTSLLPRAGPGRFPPPRSPRYCNCSRLASRRCFRWAPVPTAGGWAPVAPPPLCWPDSPTRCSRTGSGAGGWLAQLGVQFGLGRGFVDAGGASSIQALGGLTALVPRLDFWGRAGASTRWAVCWLLSPGTTRSWS